MKKATLYIGGFILWIVLAAMLLAVVFYTAGCMVQRPYPYKCPEGVSISECEYLKAGTMELNQMRKLTR